MCGVTKGYLAWEISNAMQCSFRAKNLNLLLRMTAVCYRYVLQFLKFILTSRHLNSYSQQLVFQNWNRLASDQSQTVKNLVKLVPLIPTFRIQSISVPFVSLFESL